MTVTSLDALAGPGPLRAGVCVLGGGAAGLELARQLHAAGVAVTVLEGGLARFDAAHQRLHGHRVLGRPVRNLDPARPLTAEHAADRQPRLRQLGGTLNAWSGKWKLLDRVDVEGGAWPIDYDELLAWCRPVALAYGAGALFAAPPAGLPLAGVPGLAPSVHVKVEPPLRLHDSLPADLDVIVGANVVHLEAGPGGGSVHRAIVRSLAGAERAVVADTFVLAAGSLESARLLLMSDLGTASGHVGRNLLDHPKLTAGHLTLRRARDLPEARALPGGVRVGIGLDPELLRAGRLPNHCIQLSKPQEGRHPVRLFLEQLPNRASRVVLTDRLDALGLPVVGLDWRLSDADVAGFRGFVEVARERLAAAGVADLHIDPAAFSLDGFSDASHQLGTTRMAASPDAGVVDPNLRVFGLDNLHVLGSSVFPTAGHANPTLTILALARRLAARLAADVRAA